MLIHIPGNNLPAVKIHNGREVQLFASHPELRHVRHPLLLQLPVRLRCSRCGMVTESISWLPEQQRYTSSLATRVESLTRLLPIKHVAHLTCLHWHTIKDIDYQRLRRERREPERHTLRRLIMIELALFKGHRYATVVGDANTQRGCCGLAKDVAGWPSARSSPGWDRQGCAAIESVAMDMNTALDSEVREQCPQAEVVYDLFQVVAKFGREVIDRVRVNQANQLRDNSKARKLIKRSRWLLLRNPENLPAGHKVKLAELLGANLPLNTVYVMKMALKERWYAPNKDVAQRRWNEWYRQPQESMKFILRCNF